MNFGALAIESGLRPAVAQLENRQRRFTARLLSLPAGSEARGIVGVQSAIGRRLETSIGYSERMEETEITRKPEKMEAVRIVKERGRAIEEAEKDREGLTLFTDGSRLKSGATGYAVTWKAGNGWVGVKAHMGYNQEAFDAECAALARALEVAAKRRTRPKAVIIFTDVQAAMARIASEQSGPAQQYARQVRKWIAKQQEKD